MKRFPPYQALIWILALALTSAGGAYSQRINFGTWAGSNITIQDVSGTNLGFGNIVMGVGTPKTFDINQATIFRITAPAGFDLTVSIDSPPSLLGPESKTIPFSLKFAYANRGDLTEGQARLNAVEVAPGFSVVTIPVKRNTMGLPAPPPTPLDGTNNTRISAEAYLYFYGSVGPAPPDAVAGDYTGDININIEFTGN